MKTCLCARVADKTLMSGLALFGLFSFFFGRIFHKSSSLIECFGMLASFYFFIIFVEEHKYWSLLCDPLAEACTSACEDELIEVCSENIDAPDCPLRCSSCSSLDSAADMDPDDQGFLRLDAECGLEESWFITPPPCFTAGGRGPVLLETSPLENLLIEHPSMSVYAVHSSPHRQLKENSCEPCILR